MNVVYQTSQSKHTYKSTLLSVLLTAHNPRRVTLIFTWPTEIRLIQYMWSKRAISILIWTLFINTCLFGIHVEFLSSHSNLFVSLCGFAVIRRKRTKQQQRNYSHVCVVLSWLLGEKEKRPQKMANMLQEHRECYIFIYLPRWQDSEIFRIAEVYKTQCWQTFE